MKKTIRSINADFMTANELHSKLKKGYSDIEKGNIYNAASTFATFRNNHQCKK